jgi:hypothetical protein
MRLLASLTSHDRLESGGGDAPTGEDATRANGEPVEEHVEIPFIQTRHPEEHALLASCGSRLADIRVDIECVQKAHDIAGIFRLWDAFQEVCASRDLRRNVLLQQLGMKVHSTNAPSFCALLTYTIRICRSFF